VAHVDVIVAALWLKSKEPYVRHADRATQGALVLLIMATSLMTTQKLSARISSISVETLALIALCTMFPLLAIIGHIPLLHKPGKEIYGEVQFEMAKSQQDLAAEIHEHVVEHHEQTEADFKDHERHRADHARAMSNREISCPKTELRTELSRQKSCLRHVRQVDGTVLTSKCKLATSMGLDVKQEGAAVTMHPNPLNGTNGPIQRTAL
jgi:hypothetical protein